jgi:hypothetical protein
VTEQTSIEAWHRIQEQLPAARALAYGLVARYPDRNGNELNRWANTPHLHKRLSELEKMGLIYSPGTKQSSVSNQVGKFWRIVNPATIQTVPTLPESNKVDKEELMEFFVMVGRYLIQPSPELWNEIISWHIDMNSRL